MLPDPRTALNPDLLLKIPAELLERLDVLRPRKVLGRNVALMELSKASLVFMGHWCNLLTVLGRDVHTGEQLTSLPHRQLILFLLLPRIFLRREALQGDPMSLPRGRSTDKGRGGESLSQESELEYLAATGRLQHPEAWWQTITAYLDNELRTVPHGMVVKGRVRGVPGVSVPTTRAGKPKVSMKDLCRPLRGLAVQPGLGSIGEEGEGQAEQQLAATAQIIKGVTTTSDPEAATVEEEAAMESDDRLSEGSESTLESPALTVPSGSGTSRETDSETGERVFVGNPEQVAKGLREHELESDNIRRAHMMASQGQYGRATEALLRGEPVKVTEGIFADLKQMHPLGGHTLGGATTPPEEGAAAATGAAAWPEPTNEEVWDAIRKTPAMTAPGLWGWTKEMLLLTKEQMGDKDGAKAVVATAVRDLLGNRLSQEWVPFMWGGRLVPIAKDKGKPGAPGNVRPVVVGELFARVASKLVLAKVEDKIGPELAKQGQMGVAVPNGRELIVHTVRAFLELAPTANTDLALLHLDVRNAYNTASRSAIRRVLMASDELRCLVPFFDLRYPIPTDIDEDPTMPQVRVTMQDGTCRWIESREGVMQGDPVAGALCCLMWIGVMNLAWRKAGGGEGHDTSPSKALYYLDDSYAMAPSEVLKRLVPAIAEASTEAC